MSQEESRWRTINLRGYDAVALDEDLYDPVRRLVSDQLFQHCIIHNLPDRQRTLGIASMKSQGPCDAHY
jgi:hypothetical protein